MLTIEVSWQLQGYLHQPHASLDNRQPFCSCIACRSRLRFAAALPAVAAAVLQPGRLSDLQDLCDENYCDDEVASLIRDQLEPIVQKASADDFRQAAGRFDGVFAGLEHCGEPVATSEAPIA